jgi:hypothetical protein
MMDERIEKAADRQWIRARRRYERLCDVELYGKAVEGKSPTYVDAILREAWALCGSPYARITRRRWSEAALRFLAAFCE